MTCDRPHFIQSSSSSLLSCASHKSDVVFEKTVPWHRGRDNDSSSIFQWADKQQQQESHLMEEESATVISFILGKSTYSSCYRQQMKKGFDQYLVSKSHDWSIERRPESLLVGSPVGAEHSEPQQ